MSDLSQLIFDAAMEGIEITFRRANDSLIISAERYDAAKDRRWHNSKRLSPLECRQAYDDTLLFHLERLLRDLREAVAR